MNQERFRCGVVEGFYGRPWSTEQRVRLLAWMASWGLNTYLYAPKDDRKHRACWRELYTASELGALAGLIREARQRGVTFIYAIGPGLDMRYGSVSDRTALHRKIGQVQSIGCRSFALMFDDIPMGLRGLDLRRYGTTARAQAEVANRLLAFVEGQGGELQFCPTAYCGRMTGSAVLASEYLRELGERLDRAIDVFWTGPEIIAETIPVSGIRELQRVLRRKPVIWDNLQANDYDLRRIYVGPYAGRGLALRAEVAGILSNPNCEFEANYVPLRTLAAYARARRRWQPRRAYEAAVRAWLSMWTTHGRRRVARGDLELLGDCLYLPHMHGDQARRWLADFAFLCGQPVARWGGHEGRFLRVCARLERLYEIMTTMDNRELLYTFYRFAWDLKEEAALLRRYVAWLKTQPPAGARFFSPEHRPGIYRGGLVADLQRLLPMEADGGFRHPGEPPGKGGGQGGGRKRRARSSPEQDGVTYPAPVGDSRSAGR